MANLDLTSEEVLALSSAICCKIIMCEKYAEALRRLIASGMDGRDNLQKQEAEIKMYKDLWNKLMKG